MKRTLRVATNCGKHLEKLLLKNCNRLTSTTIHHLAQYSTGLQFLGLWDATEETQFHVSKLRLQALDLSECSNVGSKLFELCLGIKYLDLSNIKGNFDKKSFLTFATKNGPTLQALMLTRPTTNPTEDPFGAFFDDSTLGQFFASCPSLTHLDLTNCSRIFKVGRGQSSSAIQALTQIKGMQALILKEVPLDLSDFDRLMNAFPHLKNIFVSRISTNISSSTRRENFSPSFEVFSHRTFDQLILQNMPMLPDAFATCLRASSNHLMELDISQAIHLTDSTAEAISTCIQLVSLSIEGCQFSEKGIETIIRSCLNLIIVNFGGTNITDSNLKTLLIEKTQIHPIKKSLHTLQLSGCTRLTKECLNYIQTQKNLRVLKLSRSSFVNQDNLISLVLSLSNLNYLDVSNCQNLRKQEGAMKELLHDLVEILPTANIRIQLYK